MIRVVGVGADDLISEQVSPRVLQPRAVALAEEVPEALAPPRPACGIDHRGGVVDGLRAGVTEYGPARVPEATRERHVDEAGRKEGRVEPADRARGVTREHEAG
jgi:hypothetical protein